MPIETTSDNAVPRLAAARKAIGDAKVHSRPGQIALATARRFIGRTLALLAVAAAEQETRAIAVADNDRARLDRRPGGVRLCRADGDDLISHSAR